MIGYYLMFAYKEQQAWVMRMEKTTHTDFRVMRLNASLYSFAEDTDVEEVNEDVIINNKSYHIFKKQVKDNVLSLYYLPNTNENTVSKDLNDIVDSQLFNTGNSKKSPVKKLLKSFIKDYVAHEDNTVCFLPKKVIETVAFNTTTKGAIHAGYRSLSYSPPDFI